MRLEYKKKYISGGITVLLNLVDITSIEQEAMQAVGIPNLVLKKIYPKTKTSVNINTPLDKIINLNVFFKNDYVNYLNNLAEISSFINEVIELIRQSKKKLMADYDKFLNEETPEEEETNDYLYCSKDDGHIHIYAGEEITDRVVNKMDEGEFFFLIQNEEEG